MKRPVLPAFLLFAPALFAQMPKTVSYRGGIITPPLPKPAFTLTDTSGHLFNFAHETKGYVTLLFFGYTNCPDQCPMHMANLSTALKRLPPPTPEQIKLVFVSTDPARDTPQVLRRWLDAFDRHFIGLTGTEQTIAAAQRMAHVPVATRSGPANGNYAVAHANFVLAYGKDELAHLIYPGGVSKEDWVHDLPLLINGTCNTPSGVNCGDRTLSRENTRNRHGR